MDNLSFVFYFKAANHMNRNYNVYLLYKETKVDGSANLKGMIMVQTYLQQ